MLDALISAAIIVGFFYAAGRGIAAFYGWANDRGANRAYDEENRVSKWEFDQLKEKVSGKK